MNKFSKKAARIPPFYVMEVLERAEYWKGQKNWNAQEGISSISK